MADTDTPTERSEGHAEAYQVVARRYRPQAFSELIGQEHVAKALTQAINSNRVGHAYLFTGARGVGKTSAARVLAKALNCVHGPTPTPCNECDVCLGIISGDDVDNIEIDAASNTGVDNIRDLRQNASVRASRCRYKIYIIDEVHMLSKSAFNALLKTLEEPPEHVKFIFATTEPEKIPITILSRCQRFDFAGIESSAIAQRLSQIATAENVEIDDEALAVLSIRAAGSMRDSQSLLEQLLASGGKKITASDVYTLLGVAPGERIGGLVESIVSRNAAAAIASLDEAIAGGADVGQLVDQLLGYFRDVMAIVVGCDTSQLRYVLPSQYEQTRDLGSRLGVHTVLAMIQVLDHTSSRMRGSLHTRTLAEMAVVRLAHLDDLDNLSAVVTELRTNTPAAGDSGVKKNISPAPVAAPTPSLPSSLASSLAPPPAPRAVMAPPIEAPASLDNGVSHRVDPPAVPTTAALVTLTDDSVKQAWKQVVANLGGMLEHQAEVARDVRLASDGSVVVTFAASDQFSRDMCDSPNNRQVLERALAQHLGRGVSLKFALDQSVAVEIPTASAPPRPVSQRQLQSEVAERPFVAKAVELFAADPNRLKVTPPRNSGR
jgi:DNA polymerase-3 subunit gamma/tau